MKKYLQIIKITFQEYFEYRLNFLLWRFRSFIFTLTLIFFWLAVFRVNNSFMNYQKSHIITYVLGVILLDSIIIASRTADLGAQIKSGEIVHFLIRPVSLFKFLLARDIADKILNLLFAFVEILVILEVFKFSVDLPKDLFLILIFMVHVVISFFLYFLISLILSITAFWTDEIWATRFLFGVILLNFFSGVIFPIDILPAWLLRIIYLTPFPYLVFSPLKIWLGQVPNQYILKSLLVSFFWLIFFWWVTNYLWKRGLKGYGAYGG